jgi:hypothetical protein
MTGLFSTDPYADYVDKTTMATAPFGERVDSIGRYKLPLLPDESGPKSGGDWVPGGVQSATNLAGAIVESRQLGIWERERTQIGLALRPDLVERLTFLIRKSQMPWTDPRSTIGLNEVLPEPVDLSRLNESEAGKAIKAELALIHDEAKQTAGGNLAAQRGTNRHDAWDARAPRPDGTPGPLFGTPEVNEQIETLEKLLIQKGLERAPGLHERTVRNTTLRAAGRFDDVLRTTRDIDFCNCAYKGDGCRTHLIPAGTLLMSDLKTKRRAYYSWIEVRIQLAVYATAEWMLISPTPAAEKMYSGSEWYVPGPKHHVNQQWGVILWAPSDGGAPQLKRVNLVKGFQHAVLARAVCDARSEGKSVAAHAEAEWPGA